MLAVLLLLLLLLLLLAAVVAPVALPLLAAPPLLAAAAAAVAPSETLADVEAGSAHSGEQAAQHRGRVERRCGGGQRSAGGRVDAHQRLVGLWHVGRHREGTVQTKRE
jgi:hypothetical protein